MLKVIGAVMILWVSFYIGFALSLDGTKRVRQNAAFCRLLSSISEGISGLRLPILSVIRDFSDDTLEKCGFLPMARAKIACGEVHDIIGTTVRALKDEGRLSLDEAELALLCAYSGEAGVGDAASEVKRCDYYFQKLTALGEAAAREAPKKARVYRAVSFAVGALCVLGLL